MKIEEQAWRQIEEQFKCGIDYTDGKDVTAIAILHGEPAEAVIMALRKQLPAPVTIKGLGQLYCPSCGHGNQTGTYCQDCGQRLK